MRREQTSTNRVDAQKKPPNMPFGPQIKLSLRLKNQIDERARPGHAISDAGTKMDEMKYVGAHSAHKEQLQSYSHARPAMLSQSSSGKSSAVEVSGCAHDQAEIGRQHSPQSLEGDSPRKGPSQPQGLLPRVSGTQRQTRDRCAFALQQEITEATPSIERDEERK